jgi:hypothetical protein
VVRPLGARRFQQFGDRHAARLAAAVRYAYASFYEPCHHTAVVARVLARLAQPAGGSGQPVCAGPEGVEPAVGVSRAVINRARSAACRSLTRPSSVRCGSGSADAQRQRGDRRP